MGEMRTIALSSIRENPDALRQVNRSDPAYLGMVDSIRNVGVLKPILVRPLPSQDGEEVFGLIDGLQRYSGSLDAGKADVPCHIQTVDDLTALKYQIIGNIHKIETKPAQYTDHLLRIMAADPLMTKLQLANSLNKSEAWLNDRLRLKHLNPKIAKFVDDGQIKLSNACMLAKLPEDEQENYIDRAMTEAPNLFGPAVLARKKELEKASRSGKDGKPGEFVPHPYIQKFSVVKAEFETPVLGPILVKESGLTSAEEGFAMGVKWALHMDPRSIEVDRKLDEERKRESQRKKAVAQAERADKAAKEAAEAAMKLIQAEQQVVGV